MIFGHQDHFFSLVDSLSAIRQLSRIPIEGVTEAQLLAQALDALVEYQDLEQCSIFLQQDDVLRCAVGSGLDTFVRRDRNPASIDDECMQFAAGEGIMGLALQSGQIQYCRNCKTDTRFKPFAKTTLFYGDGSLICAPIVSDGGVLGVLNVSHHLPEFFQTWHQHFLMLFASFLGRLLHLHRLVHRLEEQVASRTQALTHALEESEQLRVLHQEHSFMDELTGLHNRRYCFAEGEAMLARAARYGQPLGVMLIHVDRLKSINDRWGYGVGDRLICCTAELLRNQARAGDLLARVGGGEFVLMLPQATPEGLESLAGRIQSGVKDLDLSVPDVAYAPTASIGMLTWCGRESVALAEQLGRLYRCADRAVQHCRRRGDGQRIFYTLEMDPPLAGETDT